MNFNQGEQIQAHKYTLSLAERAQTNHLSLKKTNKKKNACINKLRQHENIVYAVHGIIHLNNIVY